MLVGNVTAAQECGYAKEHFLVINRLYHIIVRSCTESRNFICRGFSCGHHKNRGVATALTKRFNKFVAVHTGHHYVKQNKINVLSVEYVKCVYAVNGRYRLIAVLLKHCAHQFSCVCIVFRNHYMKHIISSVSLTGVNYLYYSFLHLTEYKPSAVCRYKQIRPCRRSFLRYAKAYL